MLSKQIIEFKLKRLGPLGRTATPKTGYFHHKKISKANFRVDYYLPQKISQEAMNFIRFNQKM